MLLKILLYFFAFCGFVSVAAFTVLCFTGSSTTGEYMAAYILGSIPALSVAVWFLLPSRRVWVLWANCIALLIICCFILYCVFPCIISGHSAHLAVKRLEKFMESGKTEGLEELYEKTRDAVSNSVKEKGLNVTDHFRFMMLKYELGRYRAEEDLAALVEIIRKARIPQKEYERYKERINNLQYDNAGIIYGYGTDRYDRSKSGVKDRVRFKPRILS